MLYYILKRSFYSLLIICGVMILTFILFHLSSGDPASTVLGKNPAPEELENMRETLGSNKPLFFGKWKSTTLYPEGDFVSSRTLKPGMRIAKGKAVPTPEGLLFAGNTTLTVKRAFRKENVEKVRMGLLLKEGGNTVQLQYKLYSGSPEEIVLTFPRETLLCSLRFEIPNGHVLDSQLMDSLKELVSFSGVYPYIHLFNFGNTLQSREPIRE